MQITTKYLRQRLHYDPETAQIQTLNGEHRYLGLFDRIEDAAAAYEQAATLYHGDFACI